MPEITIISGKGGTGKTSLTGAFAHLARNHVICDLDVDAPDLHLILNPVHEEEKEFISGHTPAIDLEKCSGCGLCSEMCRYGAIQMTDNGPVLTVSSCESCKVCVHFCPEQAIEWNDRLCGHWYVSKTRFGPMVHALLLPGQENSGLLVTLLRNKAREIAEEQGKDLILSDGSPGIGCPVISSLSGTDLAVLVTEPTPSGLHDLERVAELCGHFRVPAVVIVNKYDLNEEQTNTIEAAARARGLEVVGRLAYDPDITAAMVERQVITEYKDDGAVSEIRAAWERIVAIARNRKAA